MFVAEQFPADYYDTYYRLMRYDGFGQLRNGVHALLSGKHRGVMDGVELLPTHTIANDWLCTTATRRPVSGTPLE